MHSAVSQDLTDYLCSVETSRNLYHGTRLPARPVHQKTPAEGLFCKRLRQELMLLKVAHSFSEQRPCYESLIPNQGCRFLLLRIVLQGIKDHHL